MAETCHHVVAQSFEYDVLHIARHTANAAYLVGSLGQRACRLELPYRSLVLRTVLPRLRLYRELVGMQVVECGLICHVEHDARTEA